MSYAFPSKRNPFVLSEAEVSSLSSESEGPESEADYEEVCEGEEDPEEMGEEEWSSGESEGEMECCDEGVSGVLQPEHASVEDEGKD